MFDNDVFSEIGDVFTHDDFREGAVEDAETSSCGTNVGSSLSKSLLVAQSVKMTRVVRPVAVTLTGAMSQPRWNRFRQSRVQPGLP